MDETREKLGGVQKVGGGKRSRKKLGQMCRQNRVTQRFEQWLEA